MNDFPFLLAVPDWVSILIFLVVFVVPVISQIMQNAKKNGKKVPPPPQAGGARPQQPGAGGGMKGMEADIDEFLRQAGQQPSARPQRRKQPAEPSRPAARQTVDRTQMIDDVIAAQPVPAQAALRHDGLASGVSRHVREHIESHSVTEHAEDLGRQVGASEEKMESHLREVFDHTLGALTDTSTGNDFEHVEEGTEEEVWGGEASRRKRADADVEHRAVEIRNMVRNPVDMRQAIVWSEILRRPDENDW